MIMRRPPGPSLGAWLLLKALALLFLLQNMSLHIFAVLLNPKFQPPLKVPRPPPLPPPGILSGTPAPCFKRQSVHVHTFFIDIIVHTLFSCLSRAMLLHVLGSRPRHTIHPPPLAAAERAEGLAAEHPAIHLEADAPSGPDVLPPPPPPKPPPLAKRVPPVVAMGAFLSQTLGLFEIPLPPPRSPLPSPPAVPVTPACGASWSAPLLCSARPRPGFGFPPPTFFRQRWIRCCPGSQGRLGVVCANMYLGYFRHGASWSDSPGPPIFMKFEAKDGGDRFAFVFHVPT